VQTTRQGTYTRNNQNSKKRQWGNMANNRSVGIEKARKTIKMSQTTGEVEREEGNGEQTNRGWGGKEENYPTGGGNTDSPALQR